MGEEKKMDRDQKVPKEITDENFLDGDKSPKSLDSWIWTPNRKPQKYITKIQHSQIYEN